MNETRVYAIFDVEHDQDLFDLLVGGCGTEGLGVVVSGGSEPATDSDRWRHRVRRAVRAADRVLVICGENTDASIAVASELRIVQEEQKPYLLLWGRRELMCTKPTGARPAEGMYTWTASTLQEQFSLMNRVEQREAAADGMKRSVRPRTDPHPSGP